MLLRLLTVLLSLFLCLSLASCLPHASETPPTVQTEREELPSLDGELIFDGRRYTYNGNREDVTACNDLLTLTSGGTYRLSGNLTEGALAIDAPPDETVHLILDGVTISSSYRTPLTVKQAACVILELAPDSVNTLTDAARSEATSEPLPLLACLRTQSDLIVCGEGSLVITGRAESALASSGRIFLRTGSITLSSPDVGIWVRDRLTIENATLTVTTAKRGIVTDGAVSSEGSFEMHGGRLTLCCTELAIDTGKAITITGGIGSLDAPLLYRCERTNGKETVQGEIKITAIGFPRG